MLLLIYLCLSECSSFSNGYTSHDITDIVFRKFAATTEVANLPNALGLAVSLCHLQAVVNPSRRGPIHHNCESISFGNGCETPYVLAIHDSSDCGDHCLSVSLYLHNVLFVEANL